MDYVIRRATAANRGPKQHQAGSLGRIFFGSFPTRRREQRDGTGASPSHRRAVIGVVAAAAFLVLSMNAPSAKAAFELVRTFGPDGTSATGFSSTGAVAIDHGDDLAYVLDRNAGVLYKFDLDGNPVPFGGFGPNINGNELTGLSTAANGPGRRQVAVNSATHVIYLTGAVGADEASHSVQAFQSNGEPAVFSAGPGENTNEIPGLPGISGIAVDSSGAIYVSGTRAEATYFNDVSVYGSSGALLLPDLGVTVSSPANLAVGPDGILYVLRDTISVAEYLPSEFPVTPQTTYESAPEQFDSNFAGSIAVDPLTNWVYVREGIGDNPFKVAVYDEEKNLVETFAGPAQEGALENPDGIAVGGEDEIRRVFVSDDPEGGPAQVKIFREEICENCAPTIESSAPTAVSADSAMLRARVNPNGSPSSYWFEYGEEDCAEGGCTKVPVEPVPFGSRRRGVRITQAVGGLEPGTSYHFRVAAENAYGTEFGADMRVVTQAIGLDRGLSDARAWELVSPSDKNGGTIVNRQIALTQAAASGDALVYASQGPIVERPSGSQLPAAATVLGRRDGGGLWSAEDLTPPHTAATPIRYTSEFKLFSQDLSVGEVEPADATRLSPESSEQTPYLWNSAGAPPFTPMVTASNVPLGTEFANDEGSGKIYPAVRMEGATPDLSHVVIGSEKAGLVEGAERNSLYIWHDGVLRPVSELPESAGGMVVDAMLGSGRGSSATAISEDGSRVFWAPTQGYFNSGISLPALYLRDTVAEESIRLDRPQPGASEAGPEFPAFNGASSDGSVVYFTDSQQLTSDASPSGRDLYRCEVGPVGSGVGCADLTDISVAIGETGESAEVFDQVSAISRDGTRVYFVALGVLDDAANGEGDFARAGEPNLYLWQEGSGATFIATLSRQDGSVWGIGKETAAGKSVGFASRISAAASPSGRYFAFASERSLTGYENRNDEDKPNTEVFLFDAESGGGRLSCVSCNSTGAAAVGEKLSQQVSHPADPGGLWVGRWVSANLPQPRLTQDPGSTVDRTVYRPRSVLDSGRVFFNSVDPLVPGDSNGQWDVYQYQPVGVGSCLPGTSTAVMVRSGTGCVGLLSSGLSDGPSGFLDASVSGDDVFFLTEDRLSVLDRDAEMDVYDARVDGITATRSVIAECLGESCQPAVRPPDDPSPASAAFRGPGNVRSKASKGKCPKGKRRVHRKGAARCVRPHRKRDKRHHHHHHHRVGRNGGANR